LYDDPTGYLLWMDTAEIRCGGDARSFRELGMAPVVHFKRTMPDRDDAVTFTSADRQFVFAIARRIVGENDAPDVAQDALLRAYHHRDQFRGDSRYRSWLFKIATSVSLSYLRRQRRRITTVAETSQNETDTMATDAMSPEELVARAQEHNRLQQEISRLDPGYADVLRLRFEKDMTEEAVAKALGMTVANVKIRAFRARRRLRDAVLAAA
jgi:RNA polymerase sigma-70 factor, ECF subfamily